MKKLYLLLSGCFLFSVLHAQESYNIKATPQLALSETFSDNSNRWPQYKGDTAEILLTDGGYLHKSVLKEIFIPRPAKVDLRSTANYYNLKVETTALESSSAFYGLVFGVKNRGNYNAFFINSLGDYVIREVKDGKSKDLVKMKSPKINTSKNAKNILGIQTSYGFSGFHVSYFVNGSNILVLTNSEKAVSEAKRKADEEAGNAPLLTMSGINSTHAGRLEVKGAAIGLVTNPGAAVLYDNLNLEIMPNKGNIIMYNNQWPSNAADLVYLNKSLQQEHAAMQQEQAAYQNKKIADKLAAAKKSIAELPADKLIPPGGSGKKYTPNLEAVLWLTDAFSDIGENPAFSFNPEKEVLQTIGSLVNYRIRHRLPGVTGEAILVAEQGGATIMITLAKFLSEPEVRDLLGQYLVNLCTAAGPGLGKYLDPKPDVKDLHMIGVSTGKINISSNRATTPALSPVKNDNGTWNLRLIITSK